MVGCCVARLLARIAGVQVTLVDVDPARAAVADALGVGFAAPEDADGGRDLVVHTSATSAGLQRSLDLLAPEGTVLDLSWYGDTAGRAVARRRLPLRAAEHPRQPGRDGLAGPARAPDAPPTGSRSRWTCCGIPAFDALLTGSSPFDELPEVHAPAGRRRPARALPHDHLRGEDDAMFSVTVRDHMMIAHSFRGEVFGPAQRLHGATFVVDATFRRAELDADGIVVDIGRAAERSARGPRRADLPQPRRRAGLRRHEHHHRGARPGGRRPARRAGEQASSAVRDLDGIAVTLHESHVAWASYERTL